MRWARRECRAAGSLPDRAAGIVARSDGAPRIGSAAGERADFPQFLLNFPRTPADFERVEAAHLARHWLGRARELYREGGPRVVAAAALRRLAHTTLVDEVRFVYEALAGRGAGTLVDVGAHDGGSLRRFAADGWRVLAFEPDAANRARLCERVRGFDRVTVRPVAVSDAEADAATLYRSPESTGISGLSAFHASHAPAESVAVTTLAREFAEHDIKTVDFLKVDTEGFDLFVLRGVPWDRVAPDAVVCEFEDAKTRPLGYTHRDLGDFLVEQGYRVLTSEWHPIVRYGGQHRWRRVAPWPEPLCDARGWGNFVAVRDVALHDDILARFGRVRRGLGPRPSAWLAGWAERIAPPAVRSPR